MGNTRRGRSTALRGAGGFTLAETLIAAAIGAVILLGLYLVYDVNQVTFIKGEQLADLQQNARIGIDRIVRELRLAGFYPEDPPVIPPVCPTAIQSATATSIRFLADIDSDGKTERVEYSYSGCAPDCAADPPRIQRERWRELTGGPCDADASWWDSGGAQPFTERVATNPPGLAFAYFDSAGNPIPAPVLPGSLGNIRRISVTITTQDTQTGSTAQPFTLRAEVRPRNL